MNEFELQPELRITLQYADGGLTYGGEKVPLNPEAALPAFTLRECDKAHQRALALAQSEPGRTAMGRCSMSPRLLLNSIAPENHDWLERVISAERAKKDGTDEADAPVVWEIVTKVCVET